MPKPVICFSILNAVASLPDLHNLSDAGAGAGLMGYTPANNSEMIATGRDMTGLPGLTPQPLLGNGGITPALLTHALLQMFRQGGHRVIMRVYNLDLPAQPVISNDDCALDGVEQWSCTADGVVDLVKTNLLPNIDQENKDGWISVLGECGVGGTTFSNLWLNLLLKQNVPAAGSTADPEKLRQKQMLIDHLQAEFEKSQQPLTTDALLSSERTHDCFQKAVVHLLKGIAQQKRDHPLLLAGGLMYIAPWMVLNQERPALASNLRENAAQATTRWVYDGLYKIISEDRIPGADIPLLMPKANFEKSRHESVRVYEHGLVIEGCGLGGCLVLAEQLGFTEDEILTTMDDYVARHIASFPQHLLETV